MEKIKYLKKYDNIRLDIKVYDKQYKDHSYTEYTTPETSTKWIQKEGYNRRIINFINLNIKDYNNIIITEL